MKEWLKDNVSGEGLFLAIIAFTVLFVWPLMALISL